MPSVHPTHLFDFMSTSISKPALIFPLCFYKRMEELCGSYVIVFIRKPYSYASVSLTVNLEARLAGNALASVPSTMVKINQAMIPVTP